MRSTTRIDDVPLRRDDDDEIQLEGTGAVSLRIMYDSILWTGKQGVVFVGEIFGKTDSLSTLEGKLHCSVWTLSASLPHEIQIAFQK